jgi:hypothetical protein
MCRLILNVKDALLTVLFKWCAIVNPGTAINQEAIRLSYQKALI